MKPFRLILSAVVIWGFTTSCNNEIDLYPDDAPQMLFVLGCLDGSGNLQQVKIRRLISGNEDATLMINDPAHYLPDTSLRVFLEDASGNRHQFSRVMHPPQTGGVFSQDSNLIYELDGFRPFPRRSYDLRIEDLSNGREISATIRSMSPAAFTYPTQEWVNQVKYNLTDQDRPFVIHYAVSPANILTVSIKYVDFMFSGEEICRKVSHSYPPVLLPLIGLPQYENGQVFTLNDWWLLFNRTIKDDPQVDYRQFYRFDFTVWTGDSAIAKYLDVAERFADNRKQSFNNITGGMGLFFAASSDRLTNLCPLEKFVTFLASNDTTTHLRFLPFPFAGEYTDPDSLPVNPFLSYLR